MCLKFKQKLSPKVVSAALVLCLIGGNALAETYSLQYLKSLSNDDTPKVSLPTDISSDHWIYETLKKISEKYGLILGTPGEKFDSNQALTRKEAAVMLVSLIGKIQQEKYDLTDVEKDRIEIIKKELGNEMNVLTGRVEKLEGSVSKLEKSDPQKVSVDYGENFKLKGSLQFGYTGLLNKTGSETGSGFELPLSELGVKGKLNKNIDIVANIQPYRFYNSTTTASIMGDMYASTGFIPKHTLYLGHTRVPRGVEGTQSSTGLDFVSRSQLARLHSNKRDLGVKIAGKLPYVEYFAGAYNGNFAVSSIDTNTDKDIATWINVKPFEKNKNLGELVIGGGYSTGRAQGTTVTTYNNIYNQFGSYIGYKYKKAAIKAEHSFADGLYAASGNPSAVKTQGYYITGLYDLTPKTQIALRYDYFDPNKTLQHNSTKEWTAGINYYMFKTNLKFQLNYVLVDRQTGKTSNKIMALSQYAF